MPLLEEIGAERQRQIEVKGWATEHDDQHANGEIAAAAACYLLHSLYQQLDTYACHLRRKGAFHQGVTNRMSEIWSLLPHSDGRCNLWPWGREWWKPKNKRRDLIRAAALIVAEIERLDRASAKDTPKGC